ncbi:MAG: MBL fold metallo-hydrolase [Persicimonas sp.]
MRYGGATSCVAVRAAGREIVLDAGSGIVSLSDELMARYGRDQQPLDVHVFFSHVHLDHIIGLPYFGPLYTPDATVTLWGPRNMRFDSFGETIDAFMSPPYFPIPRYEMQAEIDFHDIGAADVVYFVADRDQPIACRPKHPRHRHRVPEPDQVEMSIECMRGYNHPKSGVNTYRIRAAGKTLVYATDTEGFVDGDRRLIEFARGADALIHDAMYTEERYISMPAPTQGFGHSTVDIATQLANAADVERLFLFHHDPGNSDEVLDDLEARAKELFDGAVVARDGMSIEI